MRLGPRQLHMLKAVGFTAALVAPNPISRRLCELGLMNAGRADGSFAHITPAGLRAVADAAEAGRVSLFVMPEKKASVDEERGKRG